MHKILQFLDLSSGAVRVLSIDFSKAFDKLPHHNIITVCHNFFLPQESIRWVTSFLSCRRQRVCTGGQVSEWAPITSGVPQGSVIGPILFAMAIEDLSAVCNNTFVVKYADDVTLLHFVKTASDDSLQCEWDNLAQWSSIRDLPLNLSKCKVMDICTKKTLQLAPIQLSSGGVLRQVTSLRFLGVILSSNLKWNSHIDAVASKACQRLYIIRNLRRSGCPPCLMLQCYYAFIRSLLLYGFPSFCNVPQYLFNRLSRIEKRALKIIFGGNVPSSQVFLPTKANAACETLFSSVVSLRDHPLRCIFSARRSRQTHSNRRLERTKRFGDSFIRFCR